MSLWLLALIIIILILISAFFSGSETALTATSRARLHQLAKQGDKRAAIAVKLIENKQSLISTILIGNNLVNILASVLATTLFLRLLGESGIAVATLIMTLFIVIFAEVTPKTYAINEPDRFALAVASLMSLIIKIFTPIVFTINKIVSVIMHLFGIRHKTNDLLLSAQEELRGTFDLLHREGWVIKYDRDMLDGLLDLQELTVADVMVHRTKMISIDASQSPEDIIEQALVSTFTRIPVWRDDPENIVGILHTKKLLKALSNKKQPHKINIEDLLNKPWFIPETTDLRSQLSNFLKNRFHLALVVDEYGEVQGLVTLEDILEEIVGQIVDEHDAEIPGIHIEKGGSVIAEGATPIRNINRTLDWDLPDDEATTISGLVIHEAQLIPEPGQVFTFHNFRFEVMRRHRNKITQLRITPLSLAIKRLLMKKPQT